MFFFLRGPSSKKNVGFRGCSSLPLHICVCKSSRSLSFNGVCFTNHYLISILKEQKSGIVARHVWNTPLQSFLQKRQGLPNSVMQTSGFLIMVNEKSLKPKNSHGGSYWVLWDLEDPRYEFWVRQVDLTERALISTRFGWILKVVLKNFRRAVWNLFLSGWRAAVPFQDFRTSGKQSFAPKSTREMKRGEKSGIQFSGHSNSISIDHFYKEIPWRNSYVRNYTPFLILGIHRRVFSDTPLKHNTGKKHDLNMYLLLKKACDVKSLEPTLFISGYLDRKWIPLQTTFVSPKNRPNRWPAVSPGRLPSLSP